MIDTGSSKAEADRVLEIINHYKLAAMCFVGRPTCGDVQPMMYWITDAGAAPHGSMPGEDCLVFDPANLTVIEVGGRWKVAEGAHWLLDFGPGHGNAVAALHFIRKYGFNEICFVGRPGPSMTYFKHRRGAHTHVHFMDPRILQAAIDPPRWHTEQGAHLAEIETIIDFSSFAIGRCDDPLAGFGIKVLNESYRAKIAEQSGIRGLALSGSFEFILAQPVEQIDLLIAHFGQAPKITAVSDGKAEVSVMADDRPRQVELLRLLGQGLRNVRIDARGDVLMVQLAFPAHTRDGATTSKPSKIAPKAK